MASRFTIVGLGEALFDAFPDAHILGGAPLNVAVHAHQLAQARGGRGVVVSRVGQDDLGGQIIRELGDRGMDCQYLQTDPDRETGQVYVEFDERGQPKYQIAGNVAWDVIQFDPDLETLAQRCEAVCFGTLAQRDGQSRGTIYRFLTAAGRAVRLFDVNLRMNFYDPSILRRSCELSTAIKLNDRELPIVCRELGISWPAGSGDADAMAQAIMKRYSFKLVVLTQRERGTVIFSPAGRVEGPAVTYPPAAGADAVGAGDACAAAILVGLVLRFPLDRIVNLANHAGAFVASQPGATPGLPEAILKMAT